MKTMARISERFLLLIIMLVSATNIMAEKKNLQDGYITINGVIKNKDNNKHIGYANVWIKGTNIGTVANENGEFTLKVKSALRTEEIVVSHVGFISSIFALAGDDMKDVQIWLRPKNNVLNDVIVRGGEARNIVRDAISKIKSNYETKNCLLTGFYRETVRKRQRYINVAEAVIDIYKTDYSYRSSDLDRTRVLKGRKLLSDRKSDTLSVKLLGGPNLALYLDVVKNPEVILSDESLNYYQFKMEEPVFIDHRLQLVISFAPQVNLPYALYYGQLYIDNENLAFTRAELSLDMSDRNKATQEILKKKPSGLIFKPQALTFLMNYKERDGKMCLNYVRSEVKFKCDWKRKLFSTGYSVVSEMAVTDLHSDNVGKIPYRASFSDRDAFSDKVTAFTDDNFWEDYNIIAPTESLEKAVNKLQKQYK